MGIPATPGRLCRHARRLALLLASLTCTLAHAADGPIDTDKFFGHARMTGARISPDGHLVAMTSTALGDKGRIRLVLMDLATNKLSLLASYADADVRTFDWINDHRLVFDLVDLQEPVGQHQFAGGLFGVDTDGSHVRQLVSRQWEFREQRGDRRPLLPWYTRLLRPVGDGSENVYVYTPQGYDQKHEDDGQLMRLNTLSGRSVDVDTPMHADGWVFDGKGVPRVATTRKDNHFKVMARDPGKDQWEELADFDRFFDDKAFNPGYIDENGTLYVTANNGGDKASVWTYDLARHRMSDKPFLVSQHYDLEPAYLVAGGRLAGLRYQIDAEVTQWITPEIEALQARLDRLLPTTVNRLSLPAGGIGDYAVVLAYSDHVPGLYFLYDLKNDKLTLLGDSRPDIDPKKMADMDEVHYAARDGLEIPAYLSVPRGAARKDLPLVVLVHGGPYSRGRVWGWDPEVQFLASRGYAVLEPEFRGSTGYGQKLFTAGWKQWGLAMQDDLADGVKWAVAQGIADPKRVCIAGASYGGYAVLMGLVKDPDLYRCGIDWIGVTDIGLLFSSTRSDWDDIWKKYGAAKLIGDPVADAAQFRANSPIENAARIHAPVLLAYGDNDKRVPIEHGERFHDALMKQPGARSEWIVYKDEGHGWHHDETKIDFWNRVARFLDANIGAH